MRPYKNNHKRQKFRSNGDRSINRNLENQSLVSNNGFQTSRPYLKSRPSAGENIEW